MVLDSGLGGRKKVIFKGVVPAFEGSRIWRFQHAPDPCLFYTPFIKRLIFYRFIVLNVFIISLVY